MKSEKIKFNIIDLILLIFLLVFIVLIVMQVIKTNSKNESINSKAVTYTIMVSDIPNEIIDEIKVGDILFDNSTNQEIGKITNLSSTPHAYIGYDSEGNSVTTDSVFTSDIEITILTKVNTTDNIYYINSFQLTIGKTFDFHSEHYTLNGQIIKII